MLKILKNWFYKDSHLVIRPGAHDEQSYDVAMLTVEPVKSYKFKIIKFSSPAEATGTYGAIKPWSIESPFSTAVQLLFEQQFNYKDVTATIEASNYPTILIFANNPTIGKPYIQIIDLSTMKAAWFNMAEGEEHLWNDSKHRNFIIRRHGDTSNKEFEIIVDP